MARPVVNPIAERMYREVSPLATRDEELGYPLLHFLHAWTQPMALIESYVRDTDDGPGYSRVMDPQTAPEEFLDWLGQFVGVRPTAGMVIEDRRARVEARTGLRRGSMPAIVAEGQLTLTEPRTVYYLERPGGNAYQLRIATIEDQTPDPDATEAAFRLQKPIGIKLLYTVVPGVGGMTWGEVATRYATWADVATAFDVWADVLFDTPNL